MQHPDEGIIHAWLDGALGATESAALERHVTSCVECEARVAEARGLIAASSRIVGHLDAVPGGVVATPRKQKGFGTRMRRWYPALPVLAAAGIMLIAVRLSIRKSALEAPTLADSAFQITSTPSQDAAPVAPLPAPPSVSPSRGSGNEARRSAIGAASSPASLADRVALPPANAAAQKTTIAAAAPTPPPLTTQAQRADVSTASVAERATAPTAMSAGREPSRALARAASGVAAGAAAPTAMAEQFSLRDRAAEESLRAFGGCYEMNVSTDILPARFALVADSSAVPGRFSVKYLDESGRPAAPIVDVGWTVEGGRAVIRKASGGTLLTLAKTGSSVTGESANGPRAGRVTSCRN